MSEICGISEKELRNIISEGRKKLSRKIHTALQKSIPKMKLEAHSRAVKQEIIINRARIVSKEIGRRYFAETFLNMNVKNFLKILSRKNNLSWKMIQRIRDGIERFREEEVS